MSQIYFASTLMWSASLEQIFKMAYENGFDGIELWAQQFTVKEYSFNEYKELSSLYPVRTFVHSNSWDLNIASLNEGILEASINEIEKSIDITNAVGGYEITVHPGQFTLSVDKDEYYTRLHSSLERIYKYAKERYIDISLEIMEKKPKQFIVSKEEMEKLTGDMFDNFYYTLDVAHCDREDEVFYTLKNMKRISKIHISNRMGSKLHTPLAKGDYSFQSMIPKLQEYKMPIVVEGFDDDTEFSVLKENINFLNEIGGF